MGRHYRGDGYKIEIVIRDYNYRILDVFKFDASQFTKFYNIIKMKYGIQIKLTDKDLQWLKNSD